MGAPVQSYNRLSEEPITLHCNILNPDIVVVLDPTLMGKVDVTSGLPENGKLIVNTSQSPEEVRKKLNYRSGSVYTVDASKIAKETIGRDIPNTPMMGALAKASGLIDFERMLKDTEAKLKKKFASKPEIIQGNLNAIKKAYEEVRA